MGSSFSRSLTANSAYKVIFLGQESIVYAWIVMIEIVVIFIFGFDSALDLAKEKGLIDRTLVVFCDFAAIITLAVEAIAIPHNTMCLLGSRGIILNQEMYSLQNIMTFAVSLEEKKSLFMPKPEKYI